MTLARPWVLCFVVAWSIGCERPVQRGGLGVFNPRGLEGRVALAGQYVHGRTLQGADSAARPHHKTASGTPRAREVVKKPSP